MALNAKQLQQLKKSQKRRARKPVPSIDVSFKMKMSDRERNAYTQRFTTHLWAIETALLDHANTDAEICDRHVHDALVASVRGTTSSDAKVAALIAELAEAQQNAGAEVDDWRNGLRAIYTSLSNVSNGGEGEKSYLRFTQKFLLDARRQLGNF